MNNRTFGYLYHNWYGLGNRRVVTETMRLPDGTGPEEQIIVYDYDPLYRMTEAVYTGILSGTYTYQYDAAGNRIYHSNNVTTTETISYTYDAANRLVESVDLTTSEVTTYDWDDAGRLITTTVGSSVTRVYQYSQDGDLLQADVDGLVTTFAYDGNGQRLQLSIAGEATTFLPDYSGRSNRVLFEQGTAETKQYLYGVACLGEYVTDNATSDTEWRYYQRDGATLVRQTTNQTATITLAWTFSPEGGVVLGEEGPVTHLGCQDDAVYDWSTGLIFKGGRYFDPSLGIWLAGPALIVWGTWRPRKRRKGRKGNKSKGQTFILLVVLLLVIIPLTGCEQQDPPPACPTPEATTPPGLPSETPGLPDPTAPPPIGTPIPTDEPPPTGTQPPPTQQPPTNTPSPTPATININVWPTGGSKYQNGEHAGTIMVNYQDDYDHIGPPPIYTPSAPESTVYINYIAPILELSSDDIRTSSKGSQYYDPKVWEGLNELDLYARLVSRERASDLGTDPFDRDRVIEGLAITNVIKNRTLDPRFSGNGVGYTAQILAIGQFAFTLTDPIGGDAIEGADKWANIGNSAREREIYEHSLRYVVGVDRGWFHDPSHGAVFFGGNGTKHFSYFGHEANEDSIWYEPSWP